MEQRHNRVYSSTYELIIYRVDDEYGEWNLGDENYYRSSLSGPIFPRFLEADFSTYKGFRKFSELLGFNTVAKFDRVSTSSGEDSLDVTLKKIESGANSCIRKAHLEKVWKRTKEKLLREQKVMLGAYQACGFINPTVTVSQGKIKPYYVKTKRDLRKVGSKISKIMDAGTSYIENNVDYNFFLSIDFDDNEKGNFNSLLIEPNLALRPKTFLARCYLEMMELSLDGKRLRKCKNCHEFFLPNRPNEAYCSRIAPSARRKLPPPLQHKFFDKEVITSEWLEGKTFEKPSFVLPRRGDPLLEMTKKQEVYTCKHVGPQIAWQKSLANDNRKMKFNDEKKKRQNHLYYLKKKGRIKEYNEKKKEFEEWIKKNKPKPKRR